MLSHAIITFQTRIVEFSHFTKVVFLIPVVFNVKIHYYREQNEEKPYGIWI